MITGQTELSSLPALSAKEIQALAAAGITTIANLLEYFPKRYEDRRQFDRFPNQATAKSVCLTGGVIDAGNKGFGKMRFYEAIIMDGSGSVFGSGKVTCRWFNMPFMSKVIAAGQQVIAYGKVKEQGGRLIIDHPEIEVIDDDGETETIHLNRIVPIYKNISGINQRRLREAIYVAADCIRHANYFPYLVSESDRKADLRETHFPSSAESAKAARRRFALEAFFNLQLNVVWQRNRYRSHQGRVLGKKTTLLKAFYSSLPFDLTNAQKRSIKEIIADMRESRPMNRLLQGDVGAGKTFVAMAAMLLAIDSGADAALMAPTQILAEQHFLTFKKWLEPLGVKLVLRTANKHESTIAESHAPTIFIGTHALLYDPELFTDLGLVVIDEQHKFGVVQRAALIRHGTLPDVLVMTATPIPRTLTMTIYGDLDVSLLDEKPAGRGKIITALRTKPKQKDITDFVKAQLAEGRQAYLVYPLVEESDSIKAESATEAFTAWQKRLGAENVGLIHGKLRPEEKDAVMEDFRSGKTQALVATSVIEVGVDVPNANLMILHHAERFGLAQLHQLRGRIGRGEHKSYCILLTDSKLPEALEKLAVLEKTNDGFEIAEADLELRGPGDVLGTAQSGLTDLRFADFITDTQLIREARALADQVFHEDPDLSKKHQNLRELIAEAEAPHNA
ncbi:MAG: ATP-dependent DNA helicase RecG [Akkermansiaceae bacterium]|nr:ATP-dependent DNA helicase RecG [Luteolibacter sp.]